MGEKGVGKLSRETPPPREGKPMGAVLSTMSAWLLGKKKNPKVCFLALETRLRYEE